MLDVVFYGHDQRDRLDLCERRFQSFTQLARFLASRRAFRWQWAEIHQPGPDGRLRVFRYAADSLRTMLESSRHSPSLN